MLRLKGVLTKDFFLNREERGEKLLRIKTLVPLREVHLLNTTANGIVSPVWASPTWGIQAVLQQTGMLLQSPSHGEESWLLKNQRKPRYRKTPASWKQSFPIKLFLLDIFSHYHSADFLFDLIFCHCYCSLKKWSEHADRLHQDEDEFKRQEQRICKRNPWEKRSSHAFHHQESPLMKHILQDECYGLTSPLHLCSGQYKDFLISMNSSVNAFISLGYTASPWVTKQHHMQPSFHTI